MRVLYFDAKIEVYLDTDSPMTTDKMAISIENEICICADVPQASWVVEYAIKDVRVSFAGEGVPVDDEDKNTN